MAKVCIVCAKEVDGNAYRVKDDRVIKMIRAIKQKLNLARNNELYVCEPCFPVYQPKRKNFEKNMVYAAALAVIMIVVLVAMQFITGFNLMMILLSIVVAAGIIVMATLIYFVPPAETEPVYVRHAQPAAEAKVVRKTKEQKAAPRKAGR